MSTSPYQPPGWYHGEGDPTGTKRYWDGELWIGEPQLMAPAQTDTEPAPPTATSLPPPPTPASVYTESSQATAALVVGIFSLLFIQLLGPLAWWLGNQELAGIAAGRRNPSKRGVARAGRILGMIATTILALMATYLGLIFAAVALSFLLS